ncbi:MAG: magnesium transporter CorA family protein [Gimesia chilikensis]|uniref:magnesium transporter CorA family protein n=1 Tax=Gimesia chilikensis TaxID=2605989 RepID=UPI0037B72ABE
MNVRVFGISDNSTLIPLPETTLSASWQDDEIQRWIDIEAATPQELEQLLTPLELRPEVLNACLQSERSERFLSQKTALYMEVTTHLGWNQPEKPYVSFLCLQTTVITIHRDRLHTIEDVIRDLDGDVPLYTNNSSALLYYLLIQIGKHTVDAALRVRDEAEQLDQASHENPAALDPQKIAELRRKISHYAAVHDDHAYSAGVLQTVESNAFRFSEQSRFFGQMLQLSQLSGQIIAGTADRVSSLQRDYDALVQNRVESRLQFLTILSAVFLPLTLISGLYGMNFNDLPGMGIKSGYLIVIGIMLATAVFTAGYFYLRGWFDKS